MCLLESVHVGGVEGVYACVSAGVMCVCFCVEIGYGCLCLQMCVWVNSMCVCVCVCVCLHLCVFARCCNLLLFKDYPSRWYVNIPSVLTHAEYSIWYTFLEMFLKIE